MAGSVITQVPGSRLSNPYRLIQHAKPLSSGFFIPMSMFTLKPGKSIWLEIGEQCAHSFYAVALMIAFILPVPVPVAALLSVAMGILRELEQKDWDWRRIGRMDMFFWSLACLIFTAIFYVWSGYEH